MHLRLQGVGLSDGYRRSAPDAAGRPVEHATIDAPTGIGEPLAGSPIRPPAALAGRGRPGPDGGQRGIDRLGGQMPITAGRVTRRCRNMNDIDIDVDELLGGGQLDADDAPGIDPDHDRDPDPDAITPYDALLVALDDLLDVADEMDAALADLRAAATRARGYAGGEDGDDAR